MVWLLSGLVLLLGLVVVVGLALAATGHLRRNREAVTALRITLRDGSSQLRARQETVREWRVGRRDTGSSDLSA